MLSFDCWLTEHLFNSLFSIEFPNLRPSGADFLHLRVVVRCMLTKRRQESVLCKQKALQQTRGLPKPEHIVVFSPFWTVWYCNLRIFAQFFHFYSKKTGMMMACGVALQDDATICRAGHSPPKSPTISHFFEEMRLWYLFSEILCVPLPPQMGIDQPLSLGMRGSSGPSGIAGLWMKCWSMVASVQRKCWMWN